MASLASKLSDTVSSEVGKAYGRTTYLATSFKVVPRGTEGAVSLEGTLAGLAAAVVFAAIGCTLKQVRGVARSGPMKRSSNRRFVFFEPVCCFSPAAVLDDKRQHIPHPQVDSTGFGVVVAAAVCANYFESCLGAAVQGNVPWLSNDIVNMLQISVAAGTAIALQAALA